MQASKENARLALEALAELRQRLNCTVRDNRDRANLLLIQGFLLAAQRKLPSELSWTRDAEKAKARRKR